MLFCHADGCNWEDECDVSPSLKMPCEKCQELYVVISVLSSFSWCTKVPSPFFWLSALFTKICLCPTCLFPVAEFWFSFIRQMLLNLEFFSKRREVKCLQQYSMNIKNPLLLFNMCLAPTDCVSQLYHRGWGREGSVLTDCCCAKWPS